VACGRNSRRRRLATVYLMNNADFEKVYVEREREGERRASYYIIRLLRSDRKKLTAVRYSRAVLRVSYVIYIIRLDDDGGGIKITCSIVYYDYHLFFFSFLLDYCDDDDLPQMCNGVCKHRLYNLMCVYNVHGLYRCNNIAIYKTRTHVINVYNNNGSRI